MVRRQAIDASFLIASVHDTRRDLANAMSTYIEIANRFPDDPRAAEALSRLAESTLKSNRPSKAQDARRTLTELRARMKATLPNAPQTGEAVGFLREAEALIELDPAFPSDPFAW